MRRFGFICHPLDFAHLSQIDGGIVKKSPRLVRQIMAQLPPHRVRTLEILSPQGSRALCEVICVWLLPDQFKTLDPRLVYRKISEAFEIARDLQCELVGLGAYTKFAGLQVAQKKSLPFALTTGNTLTAALAVRALESLIRERRWPREEIELAVVGATGSIGCAAARALASQVGTLHLAGRRERELAQVARNLQGLGCRTEIFLDAKLACQEANLILLATSEPGLLLRAGDLALGACVVDISKPANIVPDRERKDVEIFDAAVVSTPVRRKVRDWERCFPAVEGLDSEAVFACFAEAMILALEGRMESYSQGPLEINKFREILHLAARHHFFPDWEVKQWNTAYPSAWPIFPRRFGMAS